MNAKGVNQELWRDSAVYTYGSLSRTHLSHKPTHSSEILKLPHTDACKDSIQGLEKNSDKAISSFYIDLCTSIFSNGAE